MMQALANDKAQKGNRNQTATKSKSRLAQGSQKNDEKNEGKTHTCFRMPPI